MKKILAIAVATAISAPAMADLTIGGKLSMDFINVDDAGAESSKVQRDDVIINIKASSQTDAGLNVAGVISTEGDFAAPTLAYISVGNDMVTVNAGKFSNPANAANVSTSSDSSSYGYAGSNLGYFTPEIDAAVGITVAANGFTLSAAHTAAGPVAAVADVTAKDTDEDTYIVTKGSAASDNNSFVLAAGYTTGALALNYGREENEGITLQSFRADYKMDAVTLSAFSASANSETANKDVDTTGVQVAYTAGNTGLRAVYSTDDYENGDQNDLFILAASQKLGGGLAGYAEYASTDGDTADRQAITLGLAYSF